MRKISYEVDGKIEVFIDASLGKSDPLFGDEEVQSLLSQASREGWSGIDGSTIRSRVGNKLDALVKNELIKRFDHAILYPGVYFRSRIEQVLRDIAQVELPSAPKVAFAAAPAQTDSAEATRKVRAARFREAFGRDGMDHEINAFFIAINDFVAKYQKQPEKDGKLEHFAYCVNAQIRNKGVKSISPRGGLIQLEDGNHVYDYPQADFMAKYEASLVFGLIH